MTRVHVAKWFAVAAMVVLADQVTKQIAIQSLALHRPLPVLPFFNLTLTYNTGAAFSFLRDAGGWQRWFFIAIAIGVSLVMSLWLWRLPKGANWLGSSLALILGGALGNLWDRLWLGKVVDFLVFYYDRWSWPAFNVADTSICVGAACLIISAFKGEGDSGR